MKTLIYIQNFERDLKQIRFSIATIKNYSSNVKLFLEYFKQKDSPKHISSDEVKDYLIYVATNRQNRKYQTQSYNFVNGFCRLASFRSIEFKVNRHK